MKKFNDKIKFLKYFEPVFNIIFFRLKKNLEPTVNDNILIIDLHLIGDIVLLQPFLLAITNKYKSSKITLVAGPWANPIIHHSLSNVKNLNVLNFTAPWIKDFSWNKLLSFFKLILILRKTKWNVGIDMRGDIRNSFLLYISKVQYKIGYNFMSNGIFLDKIITYTDNEVHLIDYHKKMALELNLINKYDVFIPRIKINNTKKNIGIHFGASMYLRRPNSQKITEFLHNFKIKYRNCNIIVFKTNEDITISELIYNYLKNEISNVEYWEGDFNNFILKLNECTDLYCLDSGPGHIAAALSVNVHVIFGPSNPKFTAPIGENVFIYGIQKKPNCWPCNGLKCINKEFQFCYSQNLLD